MSCLQVTRPSWRLLSFPFALTGLGLSIGAGISSRLYPRRAALRLSRARGTWRYGKKMLTGSGKSPSTSIIATFLRKCRRVTFYKRYLAGELAHLVVQCAGD